MSNGVRLLVEFFRTDTGTEPVREWLKSLDQDDRKSIGEDIKTIPRTSRPFSLGGLLDAARTRARGEPLGSAVAIVESHCTSDIHGTKRHHGFASRFYQEIAEDAQARPGCCQTTAETVQG